MKKVLSVYLAAAMLLSMAAIAPASAAKKVKVTKLTLDKKNVTLEEKKSVTLKATVNPSNASNKSVTWKSNKKKVAKVSSKGKVTAVKKGKATITVTTKDGRKKAVCIVTVK